MLRFISAPSLKLGHYIYLVHFFLSSPTFIFSSLKDPIDVDLVPVFEFFPDSLSKFHVIYDVLESKNWVWIIKFFYNFIYITL